MKETELNGKTNNQEFSPVEVIPDGPVPMVEAALVELLLLAMPVNETANDLKVNEANLNMLRLEREVILQKNQAAMGTFRERLQIARTNQGIPDDWVPDFTQKAWRRPTPQEAATQKGA